MGFDARAKHIGLYPFSGQVFKTIQEQLGDYKFSSGALRLPYDDPNSKELLRKVISVRPKAIREQTEDELMSPRVLSQPAFESPVLACHLANPG